jgi:glycine/D-amino acid oxidase-like deaminating enzyme/nitrite reductase/ring-hydroxylating ferredoxin subunit
VLRYPDGVAGNEPIWRADANATRFPVLTGDLAADVAVIGAGITGLTTAALLLDQGRSVAVLDMERVGSGETGRTTAHLTEAVDARYRDIAHDFGREGARLVCESSQASIAQIERLAAKHGLSCGLRRLPGYLYTEDPGEVARLDDELDAARQAGARVAFVRDVPLPFPTAGALRFDDQAEVHPLRYLAGLARALAGAGVRIMEQTRAVEVHDGEPCRITTEAGTVTARDVVVAAHVPFVNRVLLHTKLAAYRSYAMAHRPPPGLALDGLFWDTTDPYHYTRIYTGGREPLLIVGGEDHKVGQDHDTEGCFARLAAWAQSRFGVDGVAARWSGQIIEPVDGLPYIGRNALSGHVWVATGYSGNGITFGTLAAMIISDLIAGRPNAFAELYAATRVKPVTSALDFVKENVDFPSHFLSDRLTNRDADGGALADVQRGEGKILVVDGEKVAVYRDAGGTPHALSPVCPHMGCDVRWNAAERSWDCPCHGSRFAPDGALLNGPAASDLSFKALPGRKATA